MTLQEHVPLAPLTTFGIGGPAQYFAFARSVADIREALQYAHERALPLFVLGGGSNILIADSGFDGLVLKIDLQGIDASDQGGGVLVSAGAGVIWDSLAEWAAERSLAGIEGMSGVPGTVGGGVVANIGCYGAQLSDTFVSAEVIDRHDPGKGVVTLQKEDCAFSYHDSLFCRTPGRYLVVRANFLLAAAKSVQPSYTDSRFDLAALVSSNGRPPTVMDVRTAVLGVRREKGTLADSYKSAGSFFHMPFVSAAKHQEVQERAREIDAEKEERLRPWAWPLSDGSYKLAPGFLLEYTEFKKGYVRGATGISPKHTLTIINRADARARDVALLAADMHAAVKKIFGIDLEREVEYIGDV